MKDGVMIFIFACPDCGNIRGSTVNPEHLSSWRKLCSDCFHRAYRRKGSLYIKRTRRLKS